MTINMMDLLHNTKPLRKSANPFSRMDPASIHVPGYTSRHPIHFTRETMDVLRTDIIKNYFMIGQTTKLSNRGRSKGPTLM